MAFLKEDLQHLFDDQGIDKSQYNDRVEFRDPITSYNDVSGDLTSNALHERTTHRSHGLFLLHTHISQLAMQLCLCRLHV